MVHFVFLHISFSGHPADAVEIPWNVLQKVMTRIVNEVDHVNRVFYDLTSKPPGTIEME